MSATYGVCALLSGGKDSCYSMMCAVKAGHRIICLANLRPTANEVDDTDSWMYQTVRALWFRRGC